MAMDRRRRARAVALSRREQPLAWWVWAAFGAAMLLTVPALGQGAGTPPVPEVTKPGDGGPLTVPPTPGSGAGAAPRSENPLTDGGGARPVPDTGVIRPPASGAMPVIPPPASGTMPVIPPPGTAGGQGGVVPK